MAVEVEKLIVTLEARLDGYNRGLAQAQTDTNRKLADMEARYQQMASRLKASASQAAVGVGGALAGLGTYLSVDQVINYADAWTRVRRALEQNEKIFGVSLRSAEELNAIASNTRQDLEAVSKLYIRTSNAVQEMGRSNDDAALAVESFAKALVIGQASANEQRGAIEQFSQALQKGKLDGDEFRTIMETAGVVQEALAKSFNVSRGSLLAMARAGTLTGKDIVDALIKIKPVIDEAFKNAPTTVGEGLTILNNAITQYVGKANEASRATNGIGFALKFIAENMNTVAGTAVALAAALAVPFGGAVVGGIGAIAARLLTLPSIIAGVAVSTQSLGGEINFSLKSFIDFAEAGVDAGAAMSLALNDTGASATTLKDQINALVSILSEDLLAGINVIIEAINGSAVSWGDLGAAAVLAIGGTIAAVKSLYYSITGIFKSIGPVGEIAFKEFQNGVAKVLEAIVDNFSAAINEIIAIANKIPGIEIDLIPKADFGRLSTSNAREELARIAKGVRDQTKGAYDLGDFGRKVDQKAKFEALNRAIGGYGIDKLDKTAPAAPRKAIAEKDKDRKTEFEREVAQIGKRTAALQAELETINQSVFAQERAKAAAELRAALDETARKRGTAATKEEIAAIETLSTKYAETQVEAAMLQAVKSKTDAIDVLRDEVSLLGLYGAELTEARVKQELLNEAQRLGRELLPWEERKIEETARGTAALERYRDAAREVQDASKEMLSSFVSDMRQGVSATEALGNALNRLADRLIESGLDALVTNLVGGATKTGTGFASLFGFADGGIASNGRPVPLKKFAGGGISNTAAIFGEAGPEAAIPLKGGKVPVELRMPTMPRAAPAPNNSGGPNITISLAPVFQGGGGDTAAVDKFKAEVPGLIVRTVNELFDRSPRFARSKI